MESRRRSIPFRDNEIDVLHPDIHGMRVRTRRERVGVTGAGEGVRVRSDVRDAVSV